MDIRLKRAYDPASTSDGYRVLVDRLWPRGVSKQRAKLDDWQKDLAPSGSGTNQAASQSFADATLTSFATNARGWQSSGDEPEAARSPSYIRPTMPSTIDAIVLAEVLCRGLTNPETRR